MDNEQYKELKKQIDHLQRIVVQLSQRIQHLEIQQRHIKNIQHQLKSTTTILDHRTKDIHTKG